MLLTKEDIKAICWSLCYSTRVVNTPTFKEIEHCCSLKVENIVGDGLDNVTEDIYKLFVDCNIPDSIKISDIISDKVKVIADLLKSANSFNKPGFIIYKDRIVFKKLIPSVDHGKRLLLGFCGLTGFPIYVDLSYCADYYNNKYQTVFKFADGYIDWESSLCEYNGRFYLVIQFNLFDHDRCIIIDVDGYENTQLNDLKLFNNDAFIWKFNKHLREFLKQNVKHLDYTHFKISK